MNERKQILKRIVAKEFYYKSRTKGFKVGDVYSEIKLYFKQEK